MSSATLWAVWMTCMLLPLTACGVSPGPEQPTAGGPDPKPAAPPLLGVMAVTATPKAGGLLVVVQAPTAACKLLRDKVTTRDGVADVELTLEQPGMGEIVAQVVTPVQVQLPAADFVGCKHANVRLATVQRGAQYLVAPAHELVASADLP